ncbi:MAG: hypothetical protein E7655_01800 [Ruminococcaceae bacterium]|nr:hypothetical protein [Oscillospiraceae bacterium]
MKIKQMDLHRMRIALAVLCMMAVLMAGMAVSASAVYAAGDIPDTTGSGQTSADPVVVNRFEELKAALEHPDVRYVRLNNLKQMSSEAKGQQALPYRSQNDNASAIVVVGTKSLYIAGDVTFVSSGTQYGQLFQIGNGADLTVSGSGSLTFRNSDGRLFWMSDATAVLTINGNTSQRPRLRCEAAPDGKRNIFNYAIYAARGTLNINGGLLEGSTYEGDTEAFYEDKSSGAYSLYRHGGVTIFSNVNATITGGEFRTGSMLKRSDGTLYWQTISTPVGLQINAFDGAPDLKLQGGIFSGIYYETADKTAAIGDFIPSGYLLFDTAARQPSLAKNDGEVTTPYVERDAYTPNYYFSWNSMEVLNLKDSVSFVNQIPAVSESSGYLSRFVGDGETFSFEANLSKQLSDLGFTVTKGYRHALAENLSSAEWKHDEDEKASFYVSYPALGSASRYDIVESLQVRFGSGNTVYYSELFQYHVDLAEKDEIKRVRISVKEPKDLDMLYSGVSGGVDTYDPSFIPKIESVSSSSFSYDAENAPFTISEFSWKSVIGSSMLGDDLPTNTVFNAGERFAVRVALTAKDGYRFTEKTLSLGGQFSVEFVSSTRLVLLYIDDVDEPIESFVLYMMPPIHGYAPNDNYCEIELTPEAEEMLWASKTIQWEKKAIDGSEYVAMNGAELFKAGYDYRCTVQFHANHNYDFLSTTEADVWIGDPDVQMVSYDRDTVEYCFTYESYRIQSANVEMLIPVPNDKTDDSVIQPKNLTNGVQSLTYKWMKKIDASTYELMGTGEAFEGGKEYRIEFVMKTDGIHSIVDGAKAYVNENEAVVTSCASGQMIFRYDFEVDSNNFISLEYPTPEAGQLSADLNGMDLISSSFQLSSVASISTTVEWLTENKKSFNGMFVSGETYYARFTTSVYSSEGGQIIPFDFPADTTIKVNGEKIVWTENAAKGTISYDARVFVPVSELTYSVETGGSEWKVLGRGFVDTNLMQELYPDFHASNRIENKTVWHKIDKDGNVSMLEADSFRIYSYSPYICKILPEDSGCKIFAVEYFRNNKGVEAAVSSKVFQIPEWNLADDGLFESVQVGNVVYPVRSYGTDLFVTGFHDAEYPVKFTWNSYSADKLELLEKLGYEVKVYAEEYNKLYGTWASSEIDFDTLIDNSDSIHCYYRPVNAGESVRLRIEASDGTSTFEATHMLTVNGMDWTPADVHTDVSFNGKPLGVNPSMQGGIDNKTHRLTFTWRLPEDALSSYEAYLPYRDFGGNVIENQTLSGAGYQITAQYTYALSSLLGGAAESETVTIEPEYLGEGLYAYTAEFSAGSGYTYAGSLTLSVEKDSTPIALAVPTNAVTVLLLASTEVTGSTVSGTITSFDEEPVTVALLDDSNAIVYSTTAVGSKANYSIEGVADGTYTMRVSKNHYGQYLVTITVAGEDVVKDITMLQTSASGSFTFYGTVSGKNGSETTVALSREGYIKQIKSEGEEMVFSFPNLEPAVYQLYITKAGHQSYETTINIVSEDVNEDISLIYIEKQISGSVKVLDYKDSTPVSIRVYEGTDATGVPVRESIDANWFTTFEFANLPAGTYTLAASAPGYSTATKQIVLPGDYLFMETLILLPLEKGYTVSGTIRSAGEGDTVTIRLLADMGIVKEFTGKGSELAYSLEQVPAGTYGLRITKNGHYEYSSTLVVSDNVTFDLTLYLYTANHAMLSGTITSLANYPEAYVELLQGDEVIRSMSSEGMSFSYEFTYLTAGTYTLKVTKEDHHTFSKEIQIDGKLALDIMLLPTYTGQTVSGKVVSTVGADKTTTVLLYKGSALVAEASGIGTEFAYEFTNVPAGDYILTIKKDGHETEEKAITVGDTPFVAENVELTFLGVTVSGIVTSVIGESDPITVQLLQGGTVKYTASCIGLSASYTMEKVAAGTYTLRVQKSGHAARDYTVTVDATDVTQNADLLKKGDMNGDSIVNVLDALSVKLFLDAPTEDYAKSLADFNENGTVDANDLIALVKAIAEGETA